MPPEDKDVAQEVTESPREAGGETSEAEVACSSQEKPQDLKEKEQQHSELRLRGMTPSSTDLPKIDLLFEEGGLVAKIGDKSYNLGSVTDGPITARDPAADVETGPAVMKQVGKDFDVEIGPAVMKQVGKDFDVEIGPAVIEEVGRDYDVEIGPAVIEEVGRDYDVEIGPAVIEEVGQNQSADIGPPVRQQPVGSQGDYGGSPGPARTGGDYGGNPGPAGTGGDYGGNPGTAGVDATPTLRPEAASSDLSFASVGDGIRRAWDWAFGDDAPRDQPQPERHPVGERALTAPGSDYRGENIRHEVEPITYNLGTNPDTGRTETLDDVTRMQLPDATADEQRRYAEEIKRLNGITDTNSLREGQELRLPGHNADGALITREPDGTKHTVGQDGSVKVERPDGTRVEFTPGQNGGFTERRFGPNPQDNTEVTRTPDGNGGYTERHTGQRPEDNYEVRRTPEGRYMVTDQGGQPTDRTDYNADNPDPRVERARLADAADAKISDPIARLRFHEDLDQFERRAREQNLSPQEQAKFYHEVTRLLEASDSSNENLPRAADRARIAEQIMHHAAQPGSIDQGNHSTCAAAALESQMFTRNPSAAAQVITDVATTGHYQTSDGRTVTPHSSLTRADSESQRHPPPDGDRSYASQLFQGAAIASVHSSYRQDAPARPGDTGERIRDPNNFMGTIDFPGMRPDEIQAMNRAVAGDANPLTIIEHSSMNPGDGNVHVNSEQEMKDQLAQLRGGTPPPPPNQLPQIIFVDSRNEPFWTDSRAGLAGGSGGGHFVTVTDYDPATGMATIDNQWGARTDHMNISARELFMATQKPENPDHLQNLQRAVEQNRRENVFNPEMELQLLREQKAAGQINDRQYEQGIVRVMGAAEQRWQREDRSGARGDEDQESRAHWASYQMTRQLPRAQQDRIQAAIRRQRDRA